MARSAYDRHDLELRWLEIDPFLRNIRADPRYVALPKKMSCRWTERSLTPTQSRTEAEQGRRRPQLGGA
jgi:hypothetical protein